MSTASLIREARAGAGLTQQALATAAGTSQPAIARYESGRAEPRVDTLDRILAACGRHLQTGVAPRRLERIPGRGPQGRRLRHHRAAVLRAVSELGLSNVRVFGSVARGEDTSTSDIDILVDLAPGGDVLVVSELELALARILGVTVDVTCVELLRPEVFHEATRESIPL